MTATGETDFNAINYPLGNVDPFGALSIQAAMESIDPKLIFETTNSSTRDAAITNPNAAGSPKFCYLTATNVLQRWDGSNWLSIGERKLPAPAIANVNDAIGNVTAGSFTNLATNVTTSLVLPAPAWVEAEATMWMVGAASTDLRAGINISGATTSAPNGDSWGEVAQQAGAVNGEHCASRFIECAAGTNTFTVRAYRASGTGNVAVNYVRLKVRAVAWA
ncbi:MAG: hypothetical protein WAS05_00835 [Candidatus Nanopelagicales bacterium]